MTTGPKYQHRGMSAGDRLKVMAKEIELIWLEIERHRQVIAQLQFVLAHVRLTNAQVAEVARELAFRRSEITRHRANKRTRTDAMSNMRVRQRAAQMRTVRAQEERRAA